VAGRRSSEGGDCHIGWGVPSTVDLWLSRFAAGGVSGLLDRRRGAPREQVPAAQRARQRTGQPAARPASRVADRDLGETIVIRPDMILRFVVDLAVPFTKQPGRKRPSPGQDPATHLRRHLAHPGGPGRLRRRPVLPVHRPQMGNRQLRRPHRTVHHRRLATTRSRTLLNSYQRGSADQSSTTAVPTPGQVTSAWTSYVPSPMVTYREDVNRKVARMCTSQNV
jgi:hypothetical protein